MGSRICPVRWCLVQISSGEGCGPVGSLGTSDVVPRLVHSRLVEKLRPRPLPWLLLGEGGRFLP